MREEPLPDSEEDDDLLGEMLQQVDTAAATCGETASQDSTVRITEVIQVEDEPVAAAPVVGVVQQVPQAFQVFQDAQGTPGKV